MCDVGRGKGERRGEEGKGEQTFVHLQPRGSISYFLALLRGKEIKIKQISLYSIIICVVVFILNIM